MEGDNHLQKELQRRNCQINTLLKEFDDISQVLNQKTTIIQELKNHYDPQIQDLQQQITQLTERNQELVDNKNQMDRTINEQKQQYQNDIEKYKKSIGKQEKEIYELKQSEKQKEQQINEQEEQIKQLQQQLNCFTNNSLSQSNFKQKRNQSGSQQKEKTFVLNRREATKQDSEQWLNQKQSQKMIEQNQKYESIILDLNEQINDLKIFYGEREQQYMNEIDRLREDKSISLLDQLTEEQKSELATYYENLYREAFEKQVMELMDKLDEQQTYSNK